MVLGLCGIEGVQGGIENHVDNIYQRIARADQWRIQIISRTPYHKHSESLPSNLEVKPLWSPRSPGVEALIHTLLGVLYAGVKRPDVLHIHAVGPGLFVPLARLLFLKVLFTHHGFDYEREKWGGFARGVLKLGERLASRCSHSTIAVSDTIADRLNLRGVYSTVVKNGATFSSEKRGNDALVELGLRKGKYAITVARIVPEKRQLDLIDAFRAIDQPDFKLLIVGGEGGDTAYFRSVGLMASDHPDIVLSGEVTGDRIQQLLGAAGCFVLASSHEGFSVAAMEAINAQIPLVLSDIPANKELGLDSDSYFSLGDTSALRRRLETVMSMPPDVEELRVRRSEFASRCSWDTIARQTEDVLRDVLE